MVNIELYKIFYIVAKCGSLTKAAEELFISQPAVSQAIKQLETQLGTPLFNRTHRGMELSPNGGKLIFRDVERALNLITGVESRLSELSTTASGTIRVGATDSIFSHVLADKIAGFNETYPTVRFDLLCGTTPETIEQLRQNKCDVAFVNLPVEEEVNLCATVFHLTDIFVAGRKFEGKFKSRKVPIAKLQDFPLLFMERNTVARRALDRFAQTLGLQFKPDIEVSNWDVMMQLCVRGMGVGVVPREYCRDRLESGELFEIRVDPALPVRGVGLALPKSGSPSYAVREFIKLFIPDSA